MKPLTRSQTVGQRMVITTSQCLEHQNYGQTISNVVSNQWMLQSVWHWSNSHESWSLQSLLMTRTLMLSPILHKPESWQTKIGMTWMLSRSPRGTWCDYCKMRWSTSDYRGQKQAIWQITTRRKGKIVLRHYCHDCAQEIQSWNGETWTIQQQIDYAKGVQELDVQPK